MHPLDSTRLTIHYVDSLDRVLWGLLRIATDSRGVPDATLIDSGSVDADDPDAYGIDAVALLLHRAARREA